ncbi:hypothetical protein EVAR_39350_1 [Eumeta japonica]|uniref:Uncharacterized protein n=1 Tax=Eumeta variegata TaxID=151549 RepID=A0A4C1WQL0_EUMVA|nr:hypothetical protein EVAR_39350_1 [Eumeta japonica]
MSCLQHYLTAEPTVMFFGRFLVCESRTIPSQHAANATNSTDCRLEVLDIVLLKNDSLSVQSIEVHDDQVNSDHRPEVLQLGTDPITDLQNDYGLEILSRSCPLLRNNFPPAFKDDEKAKCLANSLQDHCTNSIQLTNQRHLDEMNPVVAQLLDSPSSANFSPVTADELNAYIRDLRSKKVPDPPDPDPDPDQGPDGVSNRFFKLLPPNLILMLVAIFNTCINKAIFRFRPIEAGVHQGSVIFFIIYFLHTNNIPQHFKVQFALFAVGTTLYTLDPRLRVLTYLQTAIDTFGHWFRKWRIEVNPEKSSVMYFSKGRLEAPRTLKLFN